MRVSACIPQGIMLVYDICNEKSFENIKNWIRNIEEVSFQPRRQIDFSIGFRKKRCWILSVFTFIVIFASLSINVA